VTAKFGRGQDDIAEKVVNQLAEQGYYAEAQKKVEPPTLKAWVREQFEKGVNIPQDLFGVYAGQRATIKKG
jgi:predicted secreted acid phosphatase